MTVTPEHEALHRIFAEDEGIFASAMSRVLNIKTPVPVHLEPLSVDFTEFRPVVERRSDTVLRVEFGSGRQPPATSVSSLRLGWAPHPALRYGGH